MKTLIKAGIKLDSSKIRNRSFNLSEKVSNVKPELDSKLYQNLFFFLITLSIFLIFPELPNELEIVCNRHHVEGICNVL